MTPRSAASDANPSYLPPRYEIRKLEPKHILWADAIVCHSNVFYSAIFSLVYPDEKTARLYRTFKGAEYLVRHQIESGMSFGVFDLEYQFKRPESEATEGALYWDLADTEASPEKLLDQMDFPLCSVALSYDGHHPLDQSKMTDVIEALPCFAILYHVLEVRDPRPPESWKATAERQVLMRNATSTRREYEGQKLMKKLAQWLMREADRNGYRGIQIECGHDSVSQTWLNPPKPFKGTLISSLDSKTYEEKDEKTGEVKNPFSPSQQLSTKVFVTL
ncbi:MAG: hypothetical protein M1821_003906 [Bathelium mastoideum]|nr:MAG: hypothetical protein M1821_003906 [Bathelium mastoideum]KAI9690982.1 MAG: hypothetical protein M1822_008602 [Bathelium mastoideum]